MSEEIDIEEHDVLDNPVIKNLFPDLSVIKKEIDEYYDEASNASPEAETTTFEVSCQEEEPLDVSCQGKEALEDLCQGEEPLEDSCKVEEPLEDSCQGEALKEDSRQGESSLEDSGQGESSLEDSCQEEESLEDSCQGEEPLEDSSLGDAISTTKHIQTNEHFTSSPSHASEATETGPRPRYIQHKIIVGSKPNFKHNKIYYNSSSKEPKLVLTNVNFLLNRCRRYCKECLILFPKPNLFDLHLINMHTRHNQIPFMGKRVGNKLFKCNACDKFLSSQRNLLRHFKNLHGDVKTLKTVDRSDDKIVVNEASQRKVITGLSCFHCQQLFPTQSSLIEHIYEVLEPNKIGPNDRSKSSTNAKEPNDQLNLNNRLKEDESAKHMDELNLNRKNNLVANSLSLSHSKADNDRGDSESSLPQENNPRRRSLLNVGGLTETGNENIPKKKGKTNCDPLQNGDTKAKKHSKFYKCFICSKYNVTFEFYSRHIINDHNIKEVTEVETVPFDSQCKFCPSKTSGIKSYNVHLLKYHKKQIKAPYFPCEEQPVNKHPKNVGKKVMFALKSTLYKCMRCYLFFLSSSAAMDHSKHLEISDIWKCSVCQRIFERENMALHEKQHSFAQYFTVHTLSESEFGQVLYKCSNCTVHYSEEKILLHYLKCDSETPNSLYCKDCDILINRDDMGCHEIKHKEKLFCDFIIIETDMIDVRDISTNTAKTKRGESDMIHDRDIGTNTANTKSDKSDLVHDRHVGTNTANTKSDKYDIIHDGHIGTNTANTKSDKSDMIHFRHIGTDKANTKSDKSDMIHDRHISTNTANTKSDNSVELNDRHTSLNRAKKKNGTVKKARFGVEIFDSKLVMSFCDTCKCFISNVNMRKLHVEGKCGHMVKYVCKGCGLMLTTKTHETHKEYHKTEQISLHDYVFYDLKSEKRICPPIPDYPKCNSCGVHFLRNNDIRIHTCQEQDYITCNVCAMKLTEDSYKLHINFHSYLIPSANTKLKETALQANPDDQISNVEANSSVSDDAYIINAMSFYTCKSCQLTVNTYDKVVQHCQDHYDSKVLELNMQKRRSDYENYAMLHENEKYNKDSIKTVDFDPFYFRYNNDLWTKHIFAYVADEDISKILRNSIYRYECRLKMEKIQSGSSNTVLYICEKCQVFVNPEHLYMHAVNSRNKTCVKLSKNPCAFCGLNFISLDYRLAHEKEHERIEMNSQSYKIVLYNREEHEAFNNIMYDASNRYILYQCRNCERVVDKFERSAHKCDDNNLKICSTCGLLIDKQDFDLHSTRHDELDEFNVENIIVVMFGKPKLGNKKLRSTFSGTKYDYTMYKCKTCGLCFSTKERVSAHVCVFDTSKCECSKCGLFFSETDFKCHHKVHNTNLHYFDDLNMNIITFDASSAIWRTADDVDPKDKFGENNDKQTEKVVEKQDVIYKCDCGLNFLEELNAKQHSSICNTRIKISKQNCLKCDLLFTPGELFHHLLKHHYDKKLQFKFDVVLVSKNKK